MATETRAQESAFCAEPQKEHDWLDQLLGEWTVEGEATMEPGQPPEKMGGTETVRSLGGLWIIAEGEGDMGCDGVGKTVMTLGYDTRRNLYVGTFIGSMMTHMWVYEGSLDESGNVLTLKTMGPTMTAEGTMTNFKDVIEIKSNDHRTLTSYILDDEGKWQQIMRADYQRRS